MKPTLIQRLAVPTFLIGLLSIVLGVFAMSQSPSNAATTRTPVVSYKTVHITYLATGNDVNYSCGSGRLNTSTDWTTANLTSGNSGSSSVPVVSCEITLKVVK